MGPSSPAQGQGTSAAPSLSRSGGPQGSTRDPLPLQLRALAPAQPGQPCSRGRAASWQTPESPCQRSPEQRADLNGQASAKRRALLHLGLSAGGNPGQRLRCSDSHGGLASTPARFGAARRLRPPFPRLAIHDRDRSQPKVPAQRSAPSVGGAATPSAENPPSGPVAARPRRRSSPKPPLGALEHRPGDERRADPGPACERPSEEPHSADAPRTTRPAEGVVSTPAGCGARPGAPPHSGSPAGQPVLRPARCATRSSIVRDSSRTPPGQREPAPAVLRGFLGSLPNQPSKSSCRRLHRRRLHRRRLDRLRLDRRRRSPLARFASHASAQQTVHPEAQQAEEREAVEHEKQVRYRCQVEQQ